MVPYLLDYLKGKVGGRAMNYVVSRIPELMTRLDSYEDGRWNGPCASVAGVLEMETAWPAYAFLPSG